MAASFMEIGPKLDWTHDGAIYECYQLWRKRCEFVFKSGEEAVPPIKKWETTHKLVYTRVGDVTPSGYKLDTYWNLLQEEFQTKSSTFIRIQELWGKSKQGDQPLNEWMTKIYNLVVLCGYDAATRDRIVRDVLFFNCRSQAAKDRIVQKDP